MFIGTTCKENKVESSIYMDAECKDGVPDIPTPFYEVAFKNGYQ